MKFNRLITILTIKQLPEKETQMRKLLSALLFTVVALTAFPANISAAEGKVVVVRIQEVFRRSEYAKTMETQIKASFLQEERAIEDLQKLYRTERESLESNALLDRNSYQFQEKAMRLQLLELKLKDKVQRYQKLSRTRMADYWRSIYTDFQAAIKRLSSTGQYSIVITAPDVALSAHSEKSNAPESVMGEILQRRVQYVNPANDITEQVIQVMNDINSKRAGR